jgi:hypothetical protein
MATNPDEDIAEESVWRKVGGDGIEPPTLCV